MSCISNKENAFKQTLPLLKKIKYTKHFYFETIVSLNAEVFADYVVWLKYRIAVALLAIRVSSQEVKGRMFSYS